MNGADAIQGYRMPMHFGPSLGPRQGPDGKPFNWVDSPRRTTVSTTFLSDAAILQSFLPPGFSLFGEAEITLQIEFITELEWLAGRGYNTFGLRFPAQYQGRNGHHVGSFLAVLWENLADPIISGREELGYSKLYCEIPDARVVNGKRCYSASWLGHKFFDLELYDLGEIAPTEVPPPPRRNDGLLHYKYIPRTGAVGQADVSYATLTPSTGSNAIVKKAFKAQASHAFKKSTWEELPTFFQIVNAFADLPVYEARGAMIVETVGGKDLSDQQRLE